MSDRKSLFIERNTQETWMNEKPETPDSVLVLQALAGNQEAFEALVSRYEQSLWGL